MNEIARAHAPFVDRLAGELFTPSAEGAPPVDLYAILDGARDGRIYEQVYRSGLEYECLFSGDLPWDLARAAPYLVRLRREHAFTRWVLEQGWGRSVGIFAASRADLETLRRHFRRYLRVRDERGRGMFFRYYDPRVLRVYLPTCTIQELRFVFGPVDRFLAEGEDPTTLLGFRRTEVRLVATERSLGDAALNRAAPG